MKTRIFVFFLLAFTSKHKENAEGIVNSKQEIEESVAEYSEKKTSSQYIGVSYYKRDARWAAQRRSKSEKKVFYNGNYKDEETAAHASDTLARILMGKGDQNHKLNFPDDLTNVYPEKIRTSSNYIGVTYQKQDFRWAVQRWSKTGKKMFTNGTYKDEETAAHASDTLARILIGKGDQNHKLNFPDDLTEVYNFFWSQAEQVKPSSKYIGVSYKKRCATWVAFRRSKHEKKTISGGYHKDEESAAHASDTLARQLIANGERNHKLNFPEIYFHYRYRNKRKRYDDEDFENFSSPGMKKMSIC